MFGKLPLSTGSCFTSKLTSLHYRRLDLESGCLRESDYTFFWQGKKKEDVCKHGVGFAVRNMILNKVQLGSSATECLLSLQLNTTDGPANLLSVYAPTLMAPDDIKDNFYSQPDTIIKGFPKQEDLVILGNLNACIGSDNEAWSNCLSHFGVGKCNDNGQQLLEPCFYHELCIIHTFFGTKPHHRVSWRQPRSKCWQQLDLILMRQTHLKNFPVTRTYHSTDGDTDHYLICCRVKLQPKKFHHTKQEGKPRIDASKTQHSDHLAEFKTQFSFTFVGHYNLPTTTQWENMKNATLLTALSAFGKREGPQQNDWYHSNSARLDPFIEAKHTALQAYKDMPSPATLNTLRSARSDIQKEVTACINEYWTDLCRTIQQAADIGNVKGMYNGIKKATGPSIEKQPH